MLSLSLCFSDLTNGLGVRPFTKLTTLTHLFDMLKKTLFFSLPATLVCSAFSYTPVSVFSGTGLDLSTDTNATFPTRASSVSGTTLSFGGTGAGADEKLVNLALPTSGLPPASMPFIVDIDFTLTAGGSSDFDFRIGLSDGSENIYLQADDGNSGEFRGRFGLNESATNFFVPPGPILSTGVIASGSYPAPNSTFDIGVTLILENTSSRIIVDYDGTTASGDFASNTLDRTVPLSVFLGLQGATESISIESLDVTIVPEPSSFAALAGVAALGFVACRRRRS